MYFFEFRCRRISITVMIISHSQAYIIRVQYTIYSHWMIYRATSNSVVVVVVIIRNRYEIIIIITGQRYNKDTLPSRRIKRTRRNLHYMEYIYFPLLKILNAFVKYLQLPVALLKNYNFRLVYTVQFSMCVRPIEFLPVYTETYFKILPPYKLINI